MAGGAAIRGLASNDWYFVVKAEGYATFFKKTSPQNLGTTTDLKFELKPGTSIEVSLRDQNDQPVPGARVGIGFEEIAMTPNLIPYDSKTDEDGKLLIKGLPLKTKLEMHPSKDGYKFAWEKFEICLLYTSPSPRD